MSERYGSCFRCHGRGSIEYVIQSLDNRIELDECPRCGGTGFEGSAEAYLNREAQKDDRLLKRKYFEIGNVGENK